MGQVQIGKVFVLGERCGGGQNFLLQLRWQLAQLDRPRPGRHRLSGSVANDLGQPRRFDRSIFLR
jgi:hypothetical protein